MTTVGKGALDERFKGQVLFPGEALYDEVRSVWNAMVDRRPRVIVRCETVDDVISAIRTAREADLDVGVRCGGHSVLGLSVPHDGLMIDLTPMGAVRVDPGRRRAWVQGGALLGALDRAAQAHGLATTAGNVSHTGVGGLTLGGGMGWLAREYGLTCDSVLSVEMVTADGELVRASETENPELFWGLRGGGGNFGVVTEFEFRLHPVGTQALLVQLSYPLEDAVPVVRGWRDLAPEAPRSAVFEASIREDGLATVGFVWVGNPERGRRELLPELRALGRPARERVEEMSYIALQTMDDTPQGHAIRRYWKGHYLYDLPDAAVEAFLRRGTPDGQGDGLPNVTLQSYGGAIAEVADEDTAFSHRQVAFEYVAAAGWTDPAEDEHRMAVARRCAATLEPFASGQYVNALSDEGVQGVQRAYSPEKLARLTALKDAYDPDNVFHLNHNIRPTPR